MQTNLTFDSMPRPAGRIAAAKPAPTGRTLVRTRLLYAVVAAALWLLPTAPAVLAQQATPVAADVVHGVNLADMDLGVRPGDDFYQFANGGWLSRAEIPPDRASWDSFTELRQQTTNQLLGIMHGMQGDNLPDAGTDQWKAVRMFEQGVDMDARNAAGLSPVMPVMAKIDAITDQPSLHAFMRDAWLSGAPNLVSLSISPDLTDSSVYATYLGGPPYGLPNRDYYTGDDAETIKVRQAYNATNAKLLEMLGVESAPAMVRAQAVYDFEKQLALTTLTREQEQDLSLINNPVTVAELEAQYPAMDWPAYFASIGIPTPEKVIVTEKAYLAALPGILAATPIDTVKDFLRLQTLWNWSDSLNGELDDTTFAFVKVLSGQEQMRPLDQRILGSVSGSMPDALGKLYVAKYFPPEAKERATTLANDIVASFRARLEQNAWMTPETREKALAKLAKLSIKVGYPDADTWHTYEKVEVGSTYADTSLSAYLAQARRNYARAGTKVDRAEWRTAVQTVNAFYNPVNNEIVFPAGILQAPFFDWQADDAANYGAIGWVVGHEVTHGFDITGSQFDGDGNLANWWTPDDAAHFKALNDRLAKQFDAIAVRPDLHINGQITVGENAADLGGLQVAFAAFERREALDAATPTAALATPVADLAAERFTPEQRFFIAASTVWREKIRDAALVTQIKSDSHSPGSVRGSQPMRNMDAFYAAFGIVPGDPMYLPPDQRIVIW